MTEKPLEGRIAVVAGATRGAGRGIARMLGEAGATVYCSGRSTRNNPSPIGRPETIEETADMVDQEGGQGIAVRTDHTDPEQVQALFERVDKEQDGRLDILVNDIGGEDLAEWNPLQEADLDRGFAFIQTAVHTHIISTRHALPLLLAQGHGLIVEITDGDHTGYRGALFYDLAKTQIMRLAFGLATELRRTDIAVVAVTPGFLRSEAMLDNFGVTEANWQDAADKAKGFSESETPCFVGRAVAALAADANVKAKSGRTLASWTLAKEYGFHDIDGRRPDWMGFVLQSLDELLASGGAPAAEER
ncbi:MAG: SDR family NAD(P)-dependent oxidoreductase, partial [Pseudomonadales bacterium]|nr:SDR family NAD(P)-dependent oxidoreductase [Pseudomonadales bacterium]